MIISSTTIIQMCQKLAALSSNQAGMVSADFLNMANLVMTVLTSELLQAREEFLIYQESLPIAKGQMVIRMPYRAINGDIRHLWWQNSAGARFRLAAQSIEDNEDYLITSTGVPSGFYLIGNQAVLIPTPDAAGSLVVAYPFRPNLLVDATTTQAVFSTDNINSVTLPNIPSNFVSGVAYDIIDHTSGGGIVYYDLIGNITGNTISFTTTIPNVVVGNYVALAGQAPVPMIPEEGQGLLLETTILRLEMVRGNAARIKNSAQIVQDARKAWDMLLLNRVVSKAKPAGSGGQQFPMRPF